MSLALTLASRNLLYDRLRLIATLVGIVFSVILVMIQMGLFLGFGRMVSTMIDHASADCSGRFETSLISCDPVASAA